MNEDRKKELTDLKVAYALNMCTVSVSQIVQYNDVYVLEQEYNAILNNLNLEEMPTDIALLDTLTQILNTITFFRIQEIKKNQIEQKYQQQIKDAIWSAIPNLGVIVTSGHPLAIAMSLATQIGTGYMNYRKTKAQAVRDRTSENVELEITAIEQLNALRRELFTTAWRLADKYKFPDRYRLTENQISQYNNILMDANDVRKYERLEAIQENFEAYLPFWYNFGHTAAYISSTTSDMVQKAYYEERAKAHFNYFFDLYQKGGLNLLREDQMVASYALEYADLLMPSPQQAEMNRDKITALLGMARKNSGSANDMLQLCAIGFLKVGNFEEAAKLLKILVNEDYNTHANAKLLSRLYVVSAINGTGGSDVRAKYNILRERVNNAYLFPMPAVLSLDADPALNNEYIEQQKRLLIAEYRSAYTEFIYKYTVEVNRLLFPDEFFRKELPTDSCFDESDRAKSLRRKAISQMLASSKKEYYIQTLEDQSIRTRLIDLLNEMLSMLDGLTVFSTYDNKRKLINSIRKNLVLDVRTMLEQIQGKLSASSFDMSDYDAICKHCSFASITEEFFDELRLHTVDLLDGMHSLDSLSKAETEILVFCSAAGIEPMELPVEGTIIVNEAEEGYFSYDIWGSDIVVEEKNRDLFKRMMGSVKKYVNAIVKQGGETDFLVSGTDKFDDYFEILPENARYLKPNTLAVIDDKTKVNIDLLLTTEGIIKIENNRLTNQVHRYENIQIEQVGQKSRIRMDNVYVYFNDMVDFSQLWRLIRVLDDELKRE